MGRDDSAAFEGTTLVPRGHRYQISSVHKCKSKQLPSKCGHRVAGLDDSQFGPHAGVLE